MNVKIKRIITFNNYCEHSHKINGGKDKNFKGLRSILNGGDLSFNKNTRVDNILLFKE